MLLHTPTLKCNCIASYGGCPQEYMKRIPRLHAIKRLPLPLPHGSVRTARTSWSNSRKNHIIGKKCYVLLCFFKDFDIFNMKSGSSLSLSCARSSSCFNNDTDIKSVVTGALFSCCSMIFLHPHSVVFAHLVPVGNV